MADLLIDRKVAINAMEATKPKDPFDRYEKQNIGIDWAIEAVQSLPAVLVGRCKECKYWIPYDWMFSEVWKSQNMSDYPENEIGCTYCDMSMSSTDFCSRWEKKDG